MKKEWLLAGISVTLTLALSLGIIRWLAPQLLGIPVDLQMVRVSEEIPPFFDVVFNKSDYKSKSFLIRDPYIVRAKPLYPDSWKAGPHDILGFRNRRIPSTADVIAIGDSQTYGNKVPLEMNWPSQLEDMLHEKQAVFYTMSVGGWGAIEYHDIFRKALVFSPRVVIIAFYTGNDAHGSFRRAYADDRYASLRPNPELVRNDAPATVNAPDWPVTFKDGVHTIFTPGKRLTSNIDHKAIDAGYEIMAEVARRTAGTGRIRRPPVNPVFTIIPSKELVYAKKVAQEGIIPPDAYKKLVELERKNLEALAEKCMEIKGAAYVDVLSPLQKAALTSLELYPAHKPKNGHPWVDGHRIIAESLYSAVDRLLPPKPNGVVLSEGRAYLIIDNKRWYFTSREILEKNGWVESALPTVLPRDLAHMPHAGIIDTIDPARYGPGRFTQAGP